jgi:hypothetical protein
MHKVCCEGLGTVAAAAAPVVLRRSSKVFLERAYSYHLLPGLMLIVILITAT